MVPDLPQSLYAAELAGLACYARAVLGAVQEAGDDVVSLRFTVTNSPGDRAAIEVEVINRAGESVAGFAL